jgi:hypothetical protein
MGRYNPYQTERSRPRDASERVHPIWRGFGFIWMVGIPVFSWFLSGALIRENFRQNWYRIPAEFLIRFNDPYILVKIGLTILLSVLLFALISFIGVAIFQLGGHRRYGPLDVPPERKRPRRKY